MKPNERTGLQGPETPRRTRARVQTIEESLAIIDDAMDEARDALADDPGSDVLNRLLARNMWKKMEILKQTAVAIRARRT